MNTSDDEGLSFAIDAGVLQNEENGRAFGGCDLVWQANPSDRIFVKHPKHESSHQIISRAAG